MVHQFDAKVVSGPLRAPSALDLSTFVTAVRASLPAGNALSASDVAELKREYGATIEPARSALAEIANLERQLSDLVNFTYGLSSKDVQLLWEFAPPRMPFTPEGMDSSESLEVVDEDD